MANDKNITIIDENNLRNKIYIIRGQKVMLDNDLAEIYGYETKYFNRQIKNNIERFEGSDFMFRLTKAELDDLRCKKFTSKMYKEVYKLVWMLIYLSLYNQNSYSRHCKNTSKININI